MRPTADGRAGPFRFRKEQVRPRLGYFDAGGHRAQGSKMRIVLAREHADHPLLRRVSAHLDVERQMMSALLWSTCMKRLVAQQIIDKYAHILHITFLPAIVNRAFRINLIVFRP